MPPLALLAMLIPVVLVVAATKYFFPRTISGLEVVAQFFVAALIVWGTYQAGLDARMADKQFLNGVVTSKARDTVSCEHSYKCNCTTDEDGDETCSTCYEHIFDYDWVVHTNAANETFTIDRVDRQGTFTPPRWSAVQIKEPVALERDFENYVKASPDSLFHRLSTGVNLPKYPVGYDYSRANRVIADGVNVPDLPLWNKRLTEILAYLGPQKQSNVIVVFTKDRSPKYAENLRNSWLGGKKNDTVVVLGTPDYPRIAWVKVFSWSKKELLNVSLREDLRELGVAHREPVLQTIQRNVFQHFERRPMAEYAYLRASIEPTPLYKIIGWIMAILAPLLLGFYFHMRDEGGFGISGYRRFSY